MRTIGILLLIWSALGLFAGSLMFGDIGIAAWIGAITAGLAGIGFLIAASPVNRVKSKLVAERTVGWSHGPGCWRSVDRGYWSRIVTFSPWALAASAIFSAVGASRMSCNVPCA